MVRRIFLWIMLVVLAVSANAQDHGKCPRDPFELRSEIKQKHSSALCEAVYEASIQSEDARKRLRGVIKESSSINDGNQALWALTNFYMLAGAYRKAEKEIDQLLAANARDPEVLSEASLLHTLAQFHSLSVSRRTPTVVQGRWVEQLYQIPVSLNGARGTYVVDTGASISAMSESEAKRLGLAVRGSSAALTDGTGLSTQPVRVVDVSTLAIGEFRLRHIQFVVLPDDAMPFGRLPEGERGILGIQVLIALQSFRIGTDGTLSIHPSTSHIANTQIDLAFSSLVPTTQLTVDSMHLTFTLDTGATTTIFFPGFAEQFPKLVQQGFPETVKLTGVGGTIDAKAVRIPQLSVSVGRQVTLHTLTVLLPGCQVANAWATGKLGVDFLRAVLPITIDFRNMRLSL
jgi:predicted aspartyl protease